LPEPTFRVFVSSTWLDLGPERDAVQSVVNGMRETKFVGMEYFGSRDENTRRASLDEVDRSEVYVGIFGARYGSGITEDEYRRAREARLPCFIYFKHDSTITPDKRETDPDKAARLVALKEELLREHTVKEFNNPDALSARVVADLHRWLFDKYLPPKLEEASRAEAPNTEAQELIDAIKDWHDISRDLQSRLRQAGFNIASGERSAAVSGEDNQAVTGDRNVVANRVQGDVVQTKNVYEAATPTVSARHQLRAPVGDFVGREKEIDELTKTLRGGGSAAITGISGMGGIGKTELALYVADRLRDDYPDAQLLIDMRGTDDKPRDPADALAACVRAFVSLEAKLPDSLEDLTNLYREILNGQRALILLDNAFDSAQVRPLLPPAGSALLVTSRNVVSLPRMTRVTLEQLPAGEARELLTSIAPRIAPDLADQICFLCGYLPLAIRAAGSLLDVTADLDPVDYAAQLRDERTRLERIGTEGVDTDVEASFKLSYERLQPETARVFRQLVVFPATFDAAAEEAVCEDENHKHLSELLRRSLVLYDDTTARYRLHDLARLFADARLSVEERSAGQMHHATHYLSVLWETNDLYKQGGEALNRGLALFDLEWRNIQTGQTWAEEQSDRDNTAAELCDDYPDAGAYLLDLRQHPSERILWREAALAAARRLKNRGAEGVHLSNLGVAYAALGETRRAVKFYEQYLAIAREIGNRLGEGQALGNLGSAYYALGEMSRAIEFYEQRLSIAREVGDRRGEGIALGNLGVAYVELGETSRAVEFHEQRLSIAREVGDRRGEGIALGNLGMAYAELGETSRAIEFYEQYLAIAREIGDRRGEGNALGNLGSAYAALGETSRAIEFYEQCLAIAREIGDRREEGIALGNLGNVYSELGETSRAIEFYEQYLAITREIGDRLGEGGALFNTSLALYKLGDRAQAIAHAEEALEIFEQIESPLAASARAALDEWRGQAGRGEAGR